MGKGNEGEPVAAAANPIRSGRWIPRIFLLFLASLGGAVAVILFRDGKEWVLLVTLAASALLWGLERLEIRYIPGGRRRWHAPKGYLLPLALISVVTFAACFSTLRVYFIGDDFAYLHHFHTVSLPQLFRLFHADMAQVLWSDPRQELRPFYGLYYMVGYQLWGLHPLGYHLTNVFLHILNSLLVLLIAKHIDPYESWRPAFAALLFAVLPLHARVFFWATGAPTELIPVFFYLAAFLCFMRFRATGSVTYLVITVLAFAGCLSSKESAVTLPVMLISYDLFRRATSENVAAVTDGPARKKRWWRVILGCVPFAILLLGYLELRHIATGDYLRVSKWGNIRGAFSSLSGFWLHLTHLVARFWNLQSFNLRHLLLPYPSSVVGIVLGLYLVWAYSLLRRHAGCGRSVAPIFYFGLVWYLIANVPLLIVDPDAWHLYLPAVGPCIAASFLAFPTCDEPREERGYVRLLSFGLLAFLSAFQLWKENAPWPSRGEMSAKETTALRAAVDAVPKQTLVVIWPGRSFPFLDETLPYPLQPPFASADLYARGNIVADPYLYGPLAEWWEITKPALSYELAGPPDELVELCVLAWDERGNALQRRARALPRRLLRDCVRRSLGAPIETVNSVGVAEAKGLVEALAGLVSSG
jgi:hypothetical protein